MNLSLKNVKVNNQLSEETICFSADLYDNGKKVAYVSNRGCGGANNISPIEGGNYKDVVKYDNMDVEVKIFELVEEINFIKRYQTKHFVLKKDNTYYTQEAGASFAQRKKMRNYRSWLNYHLAKAKHEGFEVLNTNLK